MNTGLKYQTLNWLCIIRTDKDLKGNDCGGWPYVIFTIGFSTLLILSVVIGIFEANS